MAISPVLAALGEEFLRLCGLGCLDLAKEDGELFLGNLVATQQRFERVHQEHLNADEFGEDVHLHIRVAADNYASQQ